jgi:hypothetical protein
MAGPSKAAGYAGLVVTAGEPHEGGAPGCNGSRIKLNGACAACSTLDLIRQGVERAKSLRGRPPARTLQLLKEAKEARDAGDFQRAYVAASQALADLA